MIYSLARRLVALRNSAEGFDISQESGDVGKEAGQELSPLEDRV